MKPSQNLKLKQKVMQLNMSYAKRKSKMTNKYMIFIRLEMSFSLAEVDATLFFVNTSCKNEIQSNIA